MLFPSTVDNQYLGIDIPSEINVYAWQEWVDYRKNEKKKPITQAAAKKQFKLLLDYSEEQQQAIIDNSIQNDYQGLFPLRGSAAVKTKTFIEEHTDKSWRDGL